MAINVSVQYNGVFLPDIIMLTVAAWVYDSIISSGINRWGRDVHCIVGVFGKLSHTLYRS